MKLTDLTVKEFADEIASKSSVPGGGGTSALVAAVGIALGDMVGEFTVEKKKYAAVEDEIKALMLKAQELKAKLIECIDEDAIAFEPLSKAYSIPKEEPGRDEIMEQCLRDAAEVPMKILELACEAVELQAEFADKGSVIVISDAATGAALLRGAILGAACNVKINSKSMKDRAYADELNVRVDELVSKYTGLADEIFDSVYKKY